MLTPLSDPTLRAELCDVVRQAVTDPAATADAVGLEVEAFCFDAAGRRVRLGVIAEALNDAGMERLDAPDPSFRLPGALVSFEPGGQLEVSTDPAPGVSSAIDRQLAAWDLVTDAVPGHLGFCGLDTWNPVDAVPLQLRASRYPTMDAYLSARSPVGRVMMRHTASVQVNLDGGGRFLADRLATAEALAPFVTAAFATSPSPTAQSNRARVWQRLDPNRTGFLPQVGTPAEAVWSKAMAAGVMAVRRPGGWQVGSGLSFGDWLAGGHPDWGAPDAEDMGYHLTTLFCEVRPRHGTLEIRSPDAVPLPLLPALVVLITAAVYQPDASAAVLDATRGLEPDETWRRAATAGMSDPVVGPIGRRVWRAALDAAASLPGARTEHVDAAAELVERCLTPGHTLSEQLRAAWERGPEEALAWVTNRGEAG